LVGGINITDRYNDLYQPAWLDWAVYVQGEISLQLNKIARMFGINPCGANGLEPGLYCLASLRCQLKSAWFLPA
jgi:hypothetical protein